MSALRQPIAIAGQTFAAYQIIEQPAECEFAELTNQLPASTVYRPSLPEFSLATEDYCDDISEDFEPIDEPLADWLEVQADGYKSWSGPRSAWMAKRLKAMARMARFRNINDVRELEKQIDFRF